MILLANNIIAIIHLFEYNKYQISTFLLEPLTKKVCSVSFVSQYIYWILWIEIKADLAHPRT